ncbi:acyl-CoA dehydrogenase family protein [Sphingomonas sp. Leaf357]|uniref:acyl-CoA dehydrogenase family protein n=1 Tax=Sphingomonas sp. Leaf357 TaxID=1736350 RepID=UPI001443E356|nr:acyl-CoA dehydrogenase family protein [Sphingomonas sp. Leaf357]
MSLSAALEAPLADLLPIARLHAGAIGEDHSVWRQLFDLGILTAGLDEARGGSGLGATELVLIAIELGKHLVSPAIIATMVARDGTEESLRIATGFGGEEPVWIEEPGASVLLVRTDAGATLHAMPKDGQIADDFIWGVRLINGPIGAPLRELDMREASLLRLLEAAALAGIADATLAMAVDYAKTREQFGRPIGSFQAIKHHCANMAISARAARDLTTFAAVAMDTGRADAAHRTESAFLVAANAAVDNAGMNIQVHGGIGFSAEADPHLFLKRARLIVALGGGSEAAALRIAAAHITNHSGTDI